MHQHAIVVNALQHTYNYFESGIDSFGAASEPQLLKQWSEIWEASRDSASKQDFLAVMAELKRRHWSEAQAARAQAEKRAALQGAATLPSDSEPPSPASMSAKRPVPPTPQPLSSDLARAMSCPDGSLIVTVASSEKLDLLLNWVGALDSQGLECYLVGATDEHLAWDLVGRQIPAFLMYHRDQVAPDVDAAAWRDMQQASRQRVGLARALLNYDLSLVVLSDCDSVWLGDALQYARLHPDADMLVAGSHLTPGAPANDTALEPPTARLLGALDTGLLFLRHSPRTVAFVTAWAAAAEAGGVNLDTHAFQELTLAGWDAPPAPSPAALPAGASAPRPLPAASVDPTSPAASPSAAAKPAGDKGLEQPKAPAAAASPESNQAPKEGANQPADQATQGPQGKAASQDAKPAGAAVPAAAAADAKQPAAAQETTKAAAPQSPSTSAQQPEKTPPAAAAAAEAAAVQQPLPQAAKAAAHDAKPLPAAAATQDKAVPIMAAAKPAAAQEAARSAAEVAKQQAGGTPDAVPAKAQAAAAAEEKLVDAPAPKRRALPPAEAAAMAKAAHESLKVESKPASVPAKGAVRRTLLAATSAQPHAVSANQAAAPKTEAAAAPRKPGSSSMKLLAVDKPGASGKAAAQQAAPAAAAAAAKPSAAAAAATQSLPRKMKDPLQGEDESHLLSEDGDGGKPVPAAAAKPEASPQQPPVPTYDSAKEAAASGLSIITPPKGSRLIAGWHGRLLVGVLPLWLFPNGHVYWVQRLHELPGASKPLVVRTTHVFGGLPAKRHRLREAQLFADSPSYFYVPNVGPKYVSFDIPLSPNLSPGDFAHLAPEKMREYHTKGLQLQLEQFWQGMALAVALGRVLLLPRFTCFCDKHWTQMDKCRLPGADMERLPFPCPLDHVMPPDRFDDAGSELAVNIREAGALTNPRAPPELRRGVLVIRAKKDLTLPHEEWRADAGGIALNIPQDLPEGLLRQHLKPYEHYAVWHFRSPVHVMSAFDDPGLAAKFRRRVEHLRPLL